MYFWGDFWSRSVSEPHRRKWGALSGAFHSVDFISGDGLKHVRASDRKWRPKPKLNVQQVTLFCKLTAHLKGIRSFSSRVYFDSLCSVFQPGRRQPRWTLVSMATRCRFFHHSHIWPLAQETRSVHLALCLCLLFLGTFTCITLTACRTQGGMKPEAPRRLFPFSCPKKAKLYNTHGHSTRTNTGAVWPSDKYFADSDLKPVHITDRRSYHLEHL